MDHRMLSTYPINRFKVAFCSVSIYTHVGWYRIVFKGGYVPSIELFSFVISVILPTICEYSSNNLLKVHLIWSNFLL